MIVEDIVDTGLTLSYLQDILRARSPRSLRTACLLSKPSRRQTDVKVEYVGFTIEDKFVDRLRTGLRRAVPQPAVHRRDGRPETEGRKPRRSPVMSLTSPPRAPCRPSPAPRRGSPLRSASASCRSLISTLPWTIVVRTSSPRVDVDQVRDRVVHRRLPGRRHAHDDDVRALARFERPEAVAHPERARAADRRHLERRARTHGARDRSSAACAGATPSASPRTCRDRCCSRRRRCPGRSPRRPPGTPAPAPCRWPASCCFRGCATRRRRAVRRIAISGSETQTPCAASTPGPRNPRPSR